MRKLKNFTVILYLYKTCATDFLFMLILPVFYTKVAGGIKKIGPDGNRDRNQN